jgi:WhiB family redox-sensing transcriptional regulator
MTAPWTALVLMREHRVGDWIDEAACAGADPELFFPKKNDGPAREAKAVCASCPVREACRDYAVRSPVMLAGVWGGTTESERRHDSTETTNRTGFLDRFLELRELGYNDLQIVNRLRLKPESLLRQMQRHGIQASPALVQEAWKTKRNYYIKGDK